MAIDFDHGQDHAVQWTSFVRTPKYITKTQMMPRQSFTDSLTARNFVISTDIESDTYAAQTPLIKGRGECTDASAASAIGPKGATFSMNGTQPTQIIGQHPSFHFQDKLAKVKVSIFEDLGGCAPGKTLLDAVYDLTKNGSGSNDLPALAVPMKGAASPHPNFTKFRGEANVYKRYCVRLTDATGNNGLNETLKLKSGVFRVLMNDKYGQGTTGGSGKVERLEDSVPAVNASGIVASGGNKQPTLRTVDLNLGLSLTLPTCCRKARLQQLSEFI